MPPPPPAKRNRNSGPEDMEQDFASAPASTSQNFPQKTGYAKSTQHPSKYQAASPQLPQPNTISSNGNKPVNVISGIAINNAMLLQLSSPTKNNNYKQKLPLLIKITNLILK
jgi:hypothetical protein